MLNEEVNNGSSGLVKKAIIFGIIIIVLVLIVLVILKVREGDDGKKKEEVKTNYIYKIRYDFGAESYIYLYDNKVIKTEFIMPKGELCSGENCIKDTGESEKEEREIKFSDSVQNEVIKVLDELHRMTGLMEFNADDLNLTKYHERILISIMTDHEDFITIDDNIKYLDGYNDVSNDDGSKVVRNTKKYLDGSVNNKTIQNISKYLNTLVDKDFEQYNNIFQQHIDSLIGPERLGIELEIKYEYLGPYSISFVYETKVKLEEDSQTTLKGFTFNSIGSIKEFPGGMMNKYRRKVVEKFEEDELYINNVDKLDVDWETILYDSLFKTGNWYLDDDEVVFIISPSSLGITDYRDSYCINVELEEEF